MISFFFFVLTILCLPGLPDGAETPRWCYLSLFLPLMVIGRSVTLNWTAWMLIAYLSVMAGLGPLWTEALYLYWHLLLAIVAFFLFRDNVREMVIGVSGGLAVNSAVVIAQTYGWQGIPQLANYSGLFYNRNLAGEAAGMMLVMLIGYRLWWMIPGILPTFALGNRSPWLAVGVCGVAYLWTRSRILGALTLLALPAALYIGSMPIWVHAHILDSVWERWGTWSDTIEGFTFFGRGLGSFIATFPLFQHHTQALFLRFEEAHNDPLQIIYEFGIGGVILIGLVIWQMEKSFSANRIPAWYGLLAFCIEGLFGFPLIKPVTSIVAAACAGAVFGRRDFVRDLFLFVRLELRPGLAYWRIKLFPARVKPVSVVSLASDGSGLLGGGPQPG
jgi:hypothetical protein